MKPMQKNLMTLCLILALAIFIGCGKKATDDLPPISEDRMETESDEEAADLETNAADSEEDDQSIRITPCERKAYTLLPGSSQEISFTQFSSTDGYGSAWTIVQNPMERIGGRFSLEHISSDTVYQDLWTLEQDPAEPIFDGIAVRVNEIWFIRQSDSTYLISLPELPWMAYFDLSEEDMLSRISRVSKVKQALNEGKIRLSTTSQPFYLNTFHFNIEFPDKPKESGISGIEIMLKQDASEPDQKSTPKANSRPFLKVTIQYDFSSGIYTASAAHIEASCLK
jgi:hypothetical protein